MSRREGDMLEPGPSMLGTSGGNRKRGSPGSLGFLSVLGQGSDSRRA